MAASADARLQDLQKMNAAAKESVNIFDKLFAKAKLNDKDSAKLQTVQRQLYQEIADQERKLSVGSPAPKAAAPASPAIRPRPSLDLAFASPIANGGSSLKREPPKSAPRTPTIDTNGKPPAVPKGTPKGSASSQLKPSAPRTDPRRVSEVRRDSERPASSPVPRSRDDNKPAPSTPKKKPATIRDDHSASLPTTPSSSLRNSAQEDRVAHVLPVRPSSALGASLRGDDNLSHTPISFSPAPSLHQPHVPASAPAHTIATAPLSSAPKNAVLASNSAALADLEAENKRLLQAARSLEAKYEKLRLQHKDLLQYSLELEEKLVKTEADKVEVIATCLRILKDAEAQAAHHQSNNKAPPPLAPAAAEGQGAGAGAGANDDSGWLDGEDLQQLGDMPGADITVPEQQ